VNGSHVQMVTRSEAVVRMMAAGGGYDPRAWWERAGEPDAGPVFPVRIGERRRSPRRASTGSTR
jgi:hypothetical protein